MGAPGENETNLQLVRTKAAFARGRKPPELPWKWFKVLCWSKGESQEKAGCAELEVLPWVGWVGDGLTADLPCPELFSSCWVDVVPSQAFSCRGGRLSSDLKAPGMTLYHCALMINQQTNYHSQSRLLGAFLSGGAKAEKGDLVCSEHELFPTLPATR